MDLRPRTALPRSHGFDEETNGGNGDGVLSASDSVFANLQLWIDLNHDGISVAGELHSLSTLGVAALSLNPKISERRDRYGNRMCLRSDVWQWHGNEIVRQGTMYDVNLVSR